MSRTPKSATTWAVGLVTLLGACGGPDTPGPDGGTASDAASDRSPPADGGADSGSDGRTDSGSDGGTTRRDWPLPVPGEPGTGPACPEPPHGPIGEDWPEVFVGVEGCSDEGPGNREQPFCTFARAFEAVPEAPGIVTVLAGTYRQRSHRLIRPGTAEAYFVLRADEGASPRILGSDPIDGADFEAWEDGLYRVDASRLERDPKGLWTADGTRIVHVMEMRGGVRSHAPVSMLTEPGQWTKADAEGNGCGDDNAGCWIYLRPAEGMDVASSRFEASQGSFMYAGGSHYMVVDGLTMHFNQATAMFFEGARYILIQNGEFAHAANGNDNAYNLRLWGADGAIVRNNRVFDARYWGGRPNSHGITFMITGEDADIWVCGNEIFDNVGYGVTKKGGVSNVHVVGNYFHDIATGVVIGGSRCHWRGCDVRHWSAGDYDVRENLFVRCGQGVLFNDRSFLDPDDRTVPSRVYNNVFVDVERAIQTQRPAAQPLVRNNVFLGEGFGLYFSAGGTTTWPDFYIEQGFDADYDFFGASGDVYVYADWAGTERALSLAEYQDEYGGEPNARAGDPMLEDRYRPRPGSPLLGAGDPSVYPGAERVNVGLWPFLE